MKTNGKVIFGKDEKFGSVYRAKKMLVGLDLNGPTGSVLCGPSSQ